jgi:uncharacterized protein YegL
MALTDKIEVPRRTMTLFFIIDTSGSMEGAKIGAVNFAIREVIPEIKDISNTNPDALIKIAVLEFSSGAKWLTPNGPVDVNDYNWTDLDAVGTTDLGAACKTLNEKLSTKENGFMKDAAGSYAPALFLISDGEPVDDWKKELDKLKQNNWFKSSVKVALAIGDEANKDMLKEFTGTSETVMEVHNKSMLIKMVKFVSVTASQVASKSTNAVDPSQGETGDDAKQKELGAAVKEFEEEVAAAPAPAVDPDDDL